MCVHAGICNHEWKHNLFISSRKACPVWIMELIYSKGHYCENKWKCYKCKTRFYVPLFCISISCSSREKTLIYTEDPIRLHDNPGTFPNTFGRNWIKVQDKYWRKNSCTCLDVNLYDVFEFILKKDWSYRFYELLLCINSVPISCIFFVFVIIHYSGDFSGVEEEYESEWRWLSSTATQ